MSKTDELLAEIDAAVERLWQSQRRIAALDLHTVKFRLDGSTFTLAQKAMANEIEYRSSVLAGLVRKFVKECC